MGRGTLASSLLARRKGTFVIPDGPPTSPLVFFAQRCPIPRRAELYKNGNALINSFACTQTDPHASPSPIDLWAARRTSNYRYLTYVNLFIFDGAYRTFNTRRRSVTRVAGVAAAPIGSGSNIRLVKKLTTAQSVNGTNNTDPIVSWLSCII